jgi:hypothetical protein
LFSAYSNSYEPIGWIDTHHDGPDLRGGELGQAPLHSIGRPDSHPIAGINPHVEQSSGQGVDLGFVLGKVPTNILVSHHQGRPLRMGRGNTVKAAANGFVKQGFVGLTAQVALAVWQILFHVSFLPEFRGSLSAYFPSATLVCDTDHISLALDPYLELPMNTLFMVRSNA